MKQKTIQVQPTKVAIGSLKHRIVVSTRTLTPALGGALDATENLSNEKNVWAGIKTNGKGSDIFAGSELVGTATHTFYVRYISSLTAENWVTYKGEIYDVLSVEEINENGRFQALRCSLKGIENNKVNRS